MGFHHIPVVDSPYFAITLYFSRLVEVGELRVYTGLEGISFRPSILFEICGLTARPDGMGEICDVAIYAMCHNSSH